MASLLAREKRGGLKKLINDTQLTATCNCEKGERQLEREDLYEMGGEGRAAGVKEALTFLRRLTWTTSETLVLGSRILNLLP